MKLHTAFALFAFAVAGPAIASTAHAQSLFAGRGLGFLVEPLDGRNRGLGGVALGFSEGEISWANPAAAIGLPAPGMVVGYQYDSFTSSLAGDESDGSTARLPLLLAAFPAGERLVLMAGYGGFLDQNWHLERPDTLVRGADTLSIVDRATSEGGVARLRLAATYAVAEGLGLGLATDFYSGEVERALGRVFPEDFVTERSSSTWRYSGIGVTGGVHWTASEASALALSVTYGGSLDASATRGSANDTSYDLPLIVQGGASARVGQATLVALGANWSGWSSLDDALAADGGARDTWSAHAGAEWDAITIAGRNVPLRLGARTGALPFRWSEEGDGWADERALTGGLGLLLGGGAVRSDLSLEFGSRGAEAGGLDESFWRFGFSVRVLGQ
ncbi:MAG: hypothetical protein WD737_00670 [Gemmatimonadota bacterium]